MLESFVNVRYCYDYLLNQIPINLLFYTHISTVVLSLLFGTYLLTKTRKLPSVTLFIVCLTFSAWVLSDLSTWFAFLGSGNTMFTWEMIFPLTLIFFFFAYYFLYAFIKEKDLPVWQKFAGVILLAPTAVWAFLGKSLVAFDANICEASENSLVSDYYYVAQGIILLWVIIFAIRSYRQSEGVEVKKKVLWASIGVITFLSFFLTAGLSQTLLADYDIVQYAYNFGIYGLIGMPILLGFLVYLIVKYQAFNVKLLGAQALVYSLVLLIGSQFLFIQTTINQVLTGITFLIAAVFGYFLILGVKREIDLSARLKSVNSILAHDVKGVLGKDKDIFSVMLDGTFGPISDKLKDVTQNAFDATRKLISSITTILLSGHDIVLERLPFDLAEAVREVVKEVKPEADRKSLDVQVNIEEGRDFSILADRNHIVTHVLHNLIENAINYTPTGIVKINLTKKDAKTLLLTVKDSGIGITDEDKTRLFKEGGHGAESIKTNVHSTGYGLFIAKKVVDAHKGKIWAMSAGPGQGSTFSVELPVK